MPEPAMAPGGGEAGAWVPLTCGSGAEGKRGRRRNPRARAAGFIGGRGELARPRWPWRACKGVGRGRRKVGECYRSATDVWVEIGHVGRVRERGT